MQNNVNIGYLIGIKKATCLYQFTNSKYFKDRASDNTYTRILNFHLPCLFQFTQVTFSDVYMGDLR